MKNQLLLLLIALLSACQSSATIVPSTVTPTPSPVPTAKAFPNLSTSAVLYERESGGQCLPLHHNGFMGVSVWITNTGAGDAGEFSVYVNGAGLLITQGLKAGEGFHLWVPSNEPKAYVSVDAGQAISESDETDNDLRIEHLPVPTEPPMCNGTATPAAPKVDVNILPTLAKSIFCVEPHNIVRYTFSAGGFRCIFATGHETEVSFVPIKTPISPADRDYRTFYGYPMLFSKLDAPTYGPHGKERKIIWQIGDTEIQISSFDDTGIEIARDPLLIAEAIYILIAKN